MTDNRSIRSSRSLDDVGFTDESTRENRTLSLDLDPFEEENDDTTGGDEEIRVAKAMALAIQQNPQLTPAELKDLMTRARAPVKSPSIRTTKSPLLKTFSKGVKSSVKKAFKTPERESERKSGVTGMPTTDFWDSRIPSRDHSETEENNSPPATGNIRIMGIIWKRRSGLGKYSTTAAWERRRVVLKGSKLYYYRTKVEKKHDDDNTSGDEHDDDVPDHHTPPSKSKSWLDTLTVSKPKSKGDARGYLDLVKDNASVGASFGHSGAPTPFSLSIKVLAQTKWKLCFDTHGELMQWLAAMTDVIVQGSVDSYNTQILAANDPSRLVDTTAYHGQLSEPPLIANSGTTMGGHRLWVTGHYKVQSDNYPEDISEEDIEDAGLESDDDDGNDDATRHDGVVPKAPPPPGLVLSLNGGREVWAVPAIYIWQWGFLWNTVIFLARASSTTVESFWYLITFANLALFGFMTKETVGGTVKPNIPVSPRMARRLSTALGIPPSELTVTTKEKRKEEAIPEPPSASLKPKAGTTSMRIDNPTDLPVNKDGHVFAGWRWADPSLMLVRSHNYKQDKLKIPSPGEMYKCVHVDIFESRSRYPDMASRVQLPTVNFLDEGPKTWNCPDIFVVSIAIPTDPPKLYSNTENGGGYTVAVYFVMHQETRDILKRVTADGYNPKTENPNDMNKSKVNAVRLLDEWCRRAPTDDAYCARFKVLPNAQNLKEIGLPSWIAKYNGKPFLIKRPGQTGFLYRHPDKSCVEFDISLHPFPYLAKQGICFMKDTYFKKVLVTFGFLIEGRAEDELPECLIGLMQLCYPDPVHAIQGEDLMAGTSAKSFE